MQTCAGMIGQRCTCGEWHCTPREPLDSPATGMFNALPWALAGWALLILLPAMGWWFDRIAGVLCGLVIGVITCVLGTVYLAEECAPDDLPARGDRPGPGQPDDDARAPGR